LPILYEGRYEATWKREFNLPWSEVVPPNHLDDKVDSDRLVVNKEVSLSRICQNTSDRISCMGLIGSLAWVRFTLERRHGGICCRGLP
jgi:hypothetical protein